MTLKTTYFILKRSPKARYGRTYLEGQHSKASCSSLRKLQAGQICLGRPYLKRIGVEGERRIQVYLWSRKLLHLNDSISIVWIGEKERRAPRCFSHRPTLKETTGFKGTFLMFYCDPELGSSCCSIPRVSLTGWGAPPTTELQPQSSGIRNR